MAFDLGRVWRVAQTVFGIADASRRVLAPPPPDDRGPTDLAAGGGLAGQIEARLTGVLVSALKQAFDHDAERIALERAALDEQRRRAEEALRLELVRQAGDRALARFRLLGGIALVIWIVSVFFVMRLPGGFAGAARVTLGVGWASLAGALAASFAGHAAVMQWVSASDRSRTTPGDAPSGAASAAAPWLVLGGLVLVAVSLLLAL
jgi:hypothetical protein